MQVEQVTVVQKGGGDQKPPLTPPTLPLEQPAKGARREVFALDEGDVVLTFPDNLSATSFEDLDAYLKVFISKMRRRAGAGDYFMEVYASDGIKAMEVRYFDTFDALIKAASSRLSVEGEILRIHLPARATHAERRAVLDLGAEPI